MCFSASASFTASVLLGALGIVSFIQVKQPKLYFFNSIPLLFSLQQAAEGCVWLYQSHLAAQVFLFFALVIWPTVIPFSLLVLERNKKASLWLTYFTLAGCGTSLLLLLDIWLFRPEFMVDGCHIMYTIHPFLPIPGLLLALMYCLVTLMPFFISTYAYMELIGMLLWIACIVSYGVFTLYFTSVWCFFAALISSIIVIITPK